MQALLQNKPRIQVHLSINVLFVDFTLHFVIYYKHILRRASKNFRMIKLGISLLRKRPVYDGSKTFILLLEQKRKIEKYTIRDTDVHVNMQGE